MVVWGRDTWRSIEKRMAMTIVELTNCACVVFPPCSVLGANLDCRVTWNVNF